MIIYVLFPLFILAIIELLRSRQRYRLIKQIITDAHDKYPNIEKVVFSSLRYKDNFYNAAIILLELLENNTYFHDIKVEKRAEELKKFLKIDNLLYKALVPLAFVLFLFYLIMLFDKRFL